VLGAVVSGRSLRPSTDNSTKHTHTQTDDIRIQPHTM
jgi:hypothetical protein